MSPCSMMFLFFCMAVVILYHLTGRTRLRQLILAGANATFLATFRLVWVDSVSANAVTDIVGDR